MVDFMSAPFADILREVANDGRVDRQEIQLIQQRFMQDGEITQDEAEFLFDLNDYVETSDLNDTHYDEFFIEAIIAFLLNDPLSPGVLDEDEWFWLKAMIAEDMELGPLETRLLVAIADRATSVPEDFDLFAEKFQDVTYRDELSSTHLYARIHAAVQNKIRKDL